MTIKINNEEYSFDGYVYPINSIQKIAEKCYEQGRENALAHCDKCEANWNDYIAKVIADAKAEERERILGMVDWKQQEDFKRRKLVVEFDYADVLNGEQVASIICEKLKEQNNE